MANQEELLKKILDVLQQDRKETRVSRRTTTSESSSDSDDSDESRTAYDLGKIKEEYEKKIVKAKQENLKLEESILSAEEKRLEGIGKQKKELEEYIKSQLKLNKNVDEEIELLKKVNKEFEKQKEYIKSLDQINDKFKQLNNSIKETGETFVRGWLEPFMSIKGYAEYFRNVDKMRAEFAKATGAGRQFQGQVESLQQTMTAYGKTNEQVYSSFKDLSLSLTNFTNENKNVQDRLVKSALVLENLGQSSSTTGKNVSTLNAVLGTTNEKAVEMQEQLGNAAWKLGMTVTDINEKFISNLNRLSLYGQGAKDQFVRLQSFAKGTNMEVSSLLDVTEKLSTFEGSAEFAGRLNALAGKDLFDVTELTMREGQDKIDYIVEQLQGSGFDLDDPKMMRAVQQASGMDSNTFRSMMNASLGKTGALEAAAKGEMAKDPAKEAERKAKEAVTKLEEQQAIILANQNQVLNEWFPKWEKTFGFINDAFRWLGEKTQGWFFPIAGAIAALGIGTIGAIFKLRGGSLLGGSKDGGLGDKSGEGGEKGIVGLAKKLLGGGKKGDCIAICDDSLKKLANMLGGGGGGGLEDMLDFGSSGGGGTGKRRRGKGKQSRKSARKAQRKTAARKEAMRRKRGGGKGFGKFLAPALSAGTALAGFAGGGEETEGPEAIADMLSNVSTGVDVAKDIAEVAPKQGFFSRAFGAVGRGFSAAKGFVSKKIGSGALGGIFGKLFKSATPLFKLLKRVPLIGTAIDALMAGADIKQIMSNPDIDEETKKQQVGERALGVLGNLLGSMGGVALGGLLSGALTAAFPPAAIAAPWIADGMGLLGGMAGDWFARWIGEKLGAKGIGSGVIKVFGLGDDAPIGASEMEVPSEPAGDLHSGGGRFYSGPEGSYQLSPRDHIFAGTEGSFKNMSGGSSQEEVSLMREQNALLREMVNAMKDGKNPFFQANEFSTRNMRAY